MNLGSCLAKRPGELIARVVRSCRGRRGGLGEAGGWGARGWRGLSTRPRPRPRPPQSAPLAVRFSKYSSGSGSPHLCSGGGKEPLLEASGDGEGEWPSAPRGPQRLVWPWLWGPALGPRPFPAAGLCAHSLARRPPGENEDSSADGVEMRPPMRRRFPVSALLLRPLMRQDKSKCRGVTKASFPRIR
ncbi:uncharacterized protein LOC144318222 [Canis aureus]